jgi:hypothetical protein
VRCPCGASTFKAGAFLLAGRWLWWWWW